MADDPGKTAGQDPERINLDQAHEVRYWAEQFGVTAEELRSAVEAAGPMVKDVRRRLAGNRSY
jgi:Protein of unknown function (DUF3606)